MAIYLRAKGRTSPPAKTIGDRESINPTLAVLKLVATYLVTIIYFNMLQKKTRPIAKYSQTIAYVLMYLRNLDTKKVFLNTRKKYYLFWF